MQILSDRGWVLWAVNIILQEINEILFEYSLAELSIIVILVFRRFYEIFWADFAFPAY